MRGERRLPFAQWVDDEYLSGPSSQSSSGDRSGLLGEPPPVQHEPGPATPARGMTVCGQPLPAGPASSTGVRVSAAVSFAREHVGVPTVTVLGLVSCGRCTPLVNAGSQSQESVTFWIGDRKVSDPARQVSPVPLDVEVAELRAHCSALLAKLSGDEGQADDGGSKRAPSEPRPCIHSVTVCEQWVVPRANCCASS